MADRDDEDDEKEKLAEEAVDSDLEAPASVSNKDLDSPVPKADTDEDLESEERDSADAGRQALDPTASEEIANEAETTERQKNMEDRQAAAIAKAEDMVNTPDEAPEKPSESAAPQSDETSAAVATRPSSKYEDLVNQYQNLIDQRRRADTTNALVQAGSKIGQSMAGKYSGNFVPDPSQAKVLGDLANRPVTDFEQGLAVQGTGMKLAAEMAASDPNSPQSKLVRDYLNKRLGLTLGPDVSANDAAMLMKTIGRPQQTKFSQLPMVNKQTGEKIMGTYNPTTNTFQDTNGTPLDGRQWVRDYRAQVTTDPNTGEKVGFSGGTGAITGPLTGVKAIPQATIPGGPEPELTEDSLNPRQKKIIHDERNAFQKDSKAERNNLTVANKLVNLLQQGDPEDPKNMIEIERNMNTLSGASGRVPLDQLNKSGGVQSFEARLNQAIQTAKSGGLTEENKDFLLDTAKRMQGAAQQNIQAYAEPHLNALHTGITGASKNQLSGLLGVNQTANPVQFQPKGDMVQVTSSKTGKIFMLPRDKVQQALQNKLIQPLAQ
jgi:hypothetical protein